MKRRSFLGVLAAALAARKLPAAPAPTYAEELNILLDAIEQDVGPKVTRIYTRVALDWETQRKVRPLSPAWHGPEHAQFTGRPLVHGLKVQPKLADIDELVERVRATP